MYNLSDYINRRDREIPGTTFGEATLLPGNLKFRQIVVGIEYSIPSLCSNDTVVCSIGKDGKVRRKVNMDTLRWKTPLGLASELPR